MVEITDPDNLRAWLNDKPREFSMDIAARAALRSLPVLVDVLDQTNDDRADILLPCFRAIAASWFAATWPGHVPGLFTAIYESSDVSLFKKASANSVERWAIAAIDSASYAVSLDGDPITHTVDAVSSAAQGVYTVGPLYGTDEDYFWVEVDRDAKSLEMTGTVGENSPSVAVARRASDSLWPTGAPSALLNYWSRITAILHALDEDWEVWTGWYEDRLRGRLGKAELELDRVMIPNDDWRQGPRHVNAIIKRLIEEHEGGAVTTGWLPEREAEVPEQQPAPIETAIVDDRIVRAVPTLENVGTDVSAIHRILVTEAGWLSDRLSGQMPDARGSLEALRIELGADLSSTQIYGAGYWYDVLLRISHRVDETVLDDAAGRFAGFLANLDRFLKQFPEWNAYIRTAQNAELEALAGSDAEAKTGEIVDAIAVDDDLIANDVSGPLAALNRALMDAPVYNPETAYGFYRSLANVLQAVAEVAIRDGPNQIKSFAIEVGGEIRKKSASYVATSIFLASGYQLFALAGAVPSMFGFLQPILKLLGIS